MLRFDRKRAAAGGSLTAVAALVLTALAPMTAANAVPPAQPVSLSNQQPDGSTVVLSWQHAAAAVRYDVQVDDNAAFSSPEVSASTVSNSYVPTVNLRPGVQYWRVQAFSNLGEGSGWVEATLAKVAVEVPVLVSPANGVNLTQPNDPPLMRWNPSPGAVTYLVEVDDNSDFVGSKTVETRSTSMVWPDPLTSGDWFWRVVATKENPANAGLPFRSQASEARSFDITPIAAPVLTSPPSNPDFELQDVVLDWEPVPGAVSYEVEVATNTDFSDGSRIDRRSGILGTRYTPAITYDNNQYYWRVRAYDTANQPTPWSAARYDFNRTWPHRPEAVYPAAAGIEDVPAPLYFQWTSVPHASEYELQVGTQENFSVGTYHSCRTAGTTYTPGMFAINSNGQPTPFRENEDCEPEIGDINYWRVRPLDRPFSKPGDVPGVQGIFSETQAFRYLPEVITDMTPTLGQTVDVPTLRWTPGLGTDAYTVTIKKANGETVKTVTTSATSYTYDGTEKLPAGSYRWSIQASSIRGPSSLIYHNEFTISGNVPASASPALTPLTPAPSTTGIKGAPELTWAPMAGAAYYKVFVGNATDTNQVWFGSAYNNLFSAAVPYPSMTEISKRLMLSGTYDWQVEAYNSSNVRIGTGPEGRFTVQPIAAATGHSVAIGGQQLDANYTGQKNPCTQSTGGCTVPTTPVIKWDPDPRVAWYMVYVSEDASFTNLLEPGNMIPATNNSMYAPALDNDDHTYGDNQAGKAYFWYIRPCRAALDCGPDPVSTIDKAQGTFIKRSPAVTGLESSSGAGGEISFSWDDYWDSNQAYTWPQTGEKGPQAAKQYRIEVSVNGTLVESTLVDQTTFTSPSRLYPEGALTWRVQAVDSDDNGLTWSAVETVTKASPRIVPTSPAGSEVVLGTTPLRWPAQAFASSYDVQVARDDDTTFASGSLVVDRSGIQTTALTPNVPIPASDNFYVWRVRKTDASGNKGPWSVPARFKVAPATMSPIAPTTGVSVPPNGAVIQWTAVPSATRYTITARPTSGASVSANTVGTSWAPTSFLTVGTWTWTAVAYDANDKQVGTTSSSFSVDSQIQAVQAPGVESPEGTGVGKTLTSRPPQWNVAGVETTYQWLVDGQAPWSATGTTYTITANDYGKAISLRVTGKKAGYLDGTSTSSSLTVTSGDSVNNLTRPTISGSPTVGSFLTANPGTWSGNYTTSVQWMRDGQPIAGATNGNYVVAEVDGGRSITVRVTAKVSGYSDGVATSEPLVIQTLQASAAVTVSAPSGAGVGSALTLTAPVWNQSDVTTSYVWLRDGQQQWLSTGTIYTITPDDVGRVISVMATGKKPGFPDAKSVSNGVAGTSGSAPQVVSAPTIKGTPVIGQTLSVDTGTWSVNNLTFTYAWMRNGVPVPGATSGAYTITTADAASGLSVQVVASTRGRADGIAVTAPVSVPQIASKTSLSVLPSPLTKQQRGKLTITVAAPGVASPLGTLLVKDGKKTLKKLTLATKHKGVLTFKLPKLKKGKHKLSVVYSGNAVVKTSKARLVVKVGR
nr:Ig-like domain repeat protein [uncultured Nocardioides sp.]